MDSRMGATTNNYEPTSDLIQEDECDTLVLYLPGFTKEQLKVQITSTGALRISGARPIGDTKSSGFQKNFPILGNCDTNKISAKFEGGILYVRQPKLIVPAEKEVKKIIPPETAQPSTPTPIPKIDQRSRHEETAQLPEKSDMIRDEKPTKEKQNTDKTEERTYDQEKQDKVSKVAGNIGAELTDKATIDRDKGKKVSGDVDPNLADKGTKYHKIDGGDDYNIYAGLPEGRPKISGQMITSGLTALFAFLLGMYVCNLPWFSKKPGN